MFKQKLLMIIGLSTLVLLGGFSALAKNSKKGKSAEAEAGAMDLSSEIHESVVEAKNVSAQKRAQERPKKTGERARKGKRIMRVEAPRETVLVPDSVDWEHNRKSQDKKVQNLKNELEQDMAKEKN